MAGDTVQGFTNVRRTRFWQRGFLASQSAYVLAALVVLVIAMHFASPNFFTGGNVSNIVRNFSFIAIAALGMTLVIITGGIDLSVGSTMALAATVTSLTMNELNTAGFYPFPGSAMLISIFAGVAVSALIGFVNGFFIAKVKLAAFVTTLGTLSIVRGLTYVATQGRGTFPAGPDKELFLAITAGRLFDIVPMSFVYLLICACLAHELHPPPHRLGPPCLRHRWQRGGGPADRRPRRSGEDPSLHAVRAGGGRQRHHHFRLAWVGPGQPRTGL